MTVGYEGTAKDELSADAFRFVAKAVPTAYTLKGDMGSFFAQTRDYPKLDHVAERFWLHSIKSGYVCFQEEFKKLANAAINSIQLSQCPESMRDEWVRTIRLFTDIYHGLCRKRIKRNRQSYVAEAGKTLQILDSLIVLGNSLSMSLETGILDDDLNHSRRPHYLGALRHAVADTRDLAQKLEYIS